MSLCPLLLLSLLLPAVRPLGTSPLRPAPCSLLYQTVALDEGATGTNYLPSCVRVPRCSGCCEQSGFSSALYECVATGVRHERVLQVSPSIGHSPSARSLQVTRRVVRVPVHTGCECRCRHNPTGQCAHPLQRFSQETCSCHCPPPPAQCPGARFWDERQCGCQCAQHRPSYLANKPVSPVLCSSNLFFDDRKCRSVLTPSAPLHLPLQVRLEGQLAVNTGPTVNHLLALLRTTPNKAALALHLIALGRFSQRCPLSAGFMARLAPVGGVRQWAWQ